MHETEALFSVWQQKDTQNRTHKTQPITNQQYEEEITISVSYYFWFIHIILPTENSSMYNMVKIILLLQFLQTKFSLPHHTSQIFFFFWSQSGG